MRKYRCNFTPGAAVELESPLWDGADVLSIDQYPWKSAERPYTPRAEARLLHSADALWARFDIWEENIRATYTQPNDPVCRDSCVEFFFSPDADDKRYLSFEINSLGALLIGLGSSGNDTVFLTDARAAFQIQTRRRGDFWQAAYAIPFVFLKKHFSAISDELRGNFMKCADRSITPHHGCWNLIGTEVPMFHMPRFFGKIELVGRRP